MEAITILFWQWNMPGFTMAVGPLLWLIVVLLLSFLTVRFLLAAIRFFKVLTIYFEQRTENERRNIEK